MKKFLLVVALFICIALGVWYFFKNDTEEMKGTDKDKETEVKEEIKYPKEWDDKGIFRAYYNDAYELLETLSLDEKIGQLLLVRNPAYNQVEIMQQYHFGGIVFFARDFKNKTAEQVREMTRLLQDGASIPLLMAVDEEGGIVNRISQYSALVEEEFKSSSELYEIGGFEEIKKDTINKSNVLLSYGINLNFAPVVDVAHSEIDYIYERTFKQSTELTSVYAATVIEASKNTGVSYTLKHFPGYANNVDTHTSSSVDERSYEDIVKYDLPPFISGIKAGAEAVMVSHNVVSSIDVNNPASLSEAVHNILTDDLQFTGVIITDDISMSALKDIERVGTKAVLAGNHLIITTDYEKTYSEIKQAVEEGIITEEMINKLVFKILTWKYYKGLME